jgi:hypothetical protein
VKLLETLRIRATARVRRQLARAGVGEKPARVEVRLDAFDAPGPLGAAAPLRVDQWQDRLVEVIQWIGPVPVRITATADHPFLPDLVRFCHRLEMPVTVRTGPAGLDEAKAEELVDRGMGTCELVTPLDAAGEHAVRALVHARHSRAASVVVIVSYPVTAATAAGARAAFGTARGLGADGVVLAAPWQGEAFSAATAEGVRAALEEGWPLQRTGSVAREALLGFAPGGPGAPRSAGACALGGLRLALAPDGVASVCPFKPGQNAGPLADCGSALAAHREAVRRCDRQCGHPELV